MIKPILGLVLIAHRTSAQNCEDLDCDVCCAQGLNGTFFCHDDALSCRVDWPKEGGEFFEELLPACTPLIALPVICLTVEAVLHGRLRQLKAILCSRWRRAPRPPVPAAPEPPLPPPEQPGARSPPRSARVFPLRLSIQ